jgi:steroid delta-isomerase-like uncharacterized protein
MTSMDTKAIVRRLYEEVWNKRRLEVVTELISPSHALHGPNISGSAVGPEEYKHQVALFIAGFPDLCFTIEDTIAEKDKVVCYWTITGTHKGEYMRVPATNRKVSVDGVTIHYLARGKIIDSNTNWDVWGMMQQLGAVPALESSTGLRHADTQTNTSVRPKMGTAAYRD